MVAKTSTIEAKSHARLSPSSSKRWMTCPGSVRLIAAMPDVQERPSRAAAEGTVAHEVHELCLKSNHEASQYIGRTYQADGFSFTVDDEMATAVQASLDYIRDIIKQEQDDGFEVTLQVEVRSSLKYLKIPGLDGGTSDVVILVKNKNGSIIRIYVVDYKHGQGVKVYPDNNSQAMCYALGVVNLNIDLLIDSREIIVAITQPRIDEDNPASEWELNVSDIIDWQNDELVPAAKLCHEPDAPLVPSEQACRWCPASGSCPALYEKSKNLAMVDFDSFIDSEITKPDIELMTAKQKIAIIENAKMLRSFILDVENHVKQELQHGSTDYADHLKLVKANGRRRFKADAFEELESPLFDHLESDDLFVTKPSNLGDIERKLKKLLGTKPAKSLMDQVTELPEGQITVALASDKRPAVMASLDSDFSHLVDDNVDYEE